MQKKEKVASLSSPVPNSPTPALAPERKKVEERPITRTQTLKTLQGYPITVDHKCTLGESDAKIYCAKFSHDDKYIAAACDNGEVRVYNVDKERLSYNIESTRPGVPFSYVKWRPKLNYKAKNVFVTTNAEGEIQHWHLTSGKCLSTIKHDAFDPQLFCLDFNPDGTKIAVSGSDPIIRIYDEEKRELVSKLIGEGTLPPGHRSRVYCVKHTKEDPNLLLSGGWDYRIIIWDLREGKPVRGYLGPMICGDGIDICDNIILTASWTQTNQLQTWDLREGGDDLRNKALTTIDWDAALKTSNEPIFLYSGQFSKLDGALILAGGSNANEAKLFDRDNFYKCICNITDLSREVDSVDFANLSNNFCIAGGDGLIRIFSTAFSG